VDAARQDRSIAIWKTKASFITRTEPPTINYLGGALGATESGADGAGYLPGRVSAVVVLSIGGSFPGPAFGGCFGVHKPFRRPHKGELLPMKRIRFSEFLGEVEESIQEIVTKSYSSSWDENHITYSITDALASKFRSTSISDFQRPFKTKWDAWKLRGKPERLLGDLAVIVRIKTWEGETLEGVGLLEAKKRAYAKSTFEAMKLPQLQKIQSNTPSSRVLLYDYDQITGFEDNLSALALSSNRFLEWPHGQYLTAFSHAVALPTSIALARKTKDMRLYKFAIPFSVQLCSRYLRGYDLDLGEKPVKAVKGFIDRLGGPKNLLLVGVSTGDDEPSLPTGINDDLYERVG
jgi:hypothetical protein